MKKGITIMIGITGIVLLTAAVIIGAKVFPLSETNNDVQSNISPAKTRADNDTIAQVDGEELTEQEFRGVLLTEIGLGEENMSIDTALFHFARARVATNELKKMGEEDAAKDWRDYLPFMEELVEKDHDLSMRFCQHNGITREDLIITTAIIQWKLESENQLWVHRSMQNEVIDPVDPKELSAELDKKAKRLRIKYKEKEAQTILASLPNKLENVE